MKGYETTLRLLQHRVLDSELKVKICKVELILTLIYSCNSWPNLVSY